MKNLTILKNCFAFFALGFSFSTLANCPNIEDIKQKNDGTHYVHNKTGLWQQFINYQSFHGLNKDKKALSLYYLFGMKKDTIENNFYQVICIYRLVDEDNKYIVLISPKSNFKIQIKSNSMQQNEWKMLQPTKAVCIPNYSTSNNQENNFNQCEFEEIP
ncbi:hypothetical protein ACWNT8_06570 [Pigmentibacter ruber]|uniref:hypothetical protein n=1 Tax=Pigmentibacter ruber TaxID=2683196 RepID=UPI00131D77AA|nr:hypothetical protein [Pigmentibacter ruber]BFD33076.1 hypothetical protein GTC16762_26940 [Pigmentibacter ruber]